MIAAVEQEENGLNVRIRTIWGCKPKAPKIPRVPAYNPFLVPSRSTARIWD